MQCHTTRTHCLLYLLLAIGQPESIIPSLGMFIVNSSKLCVIQTTSFVFADEKDVIDVLNEVCDVASKWNGMGLALRLQQSDLDIIHLQHPNDPHSCLREVLQAWLKCKYDAQKFGSPSWELLCKAVEHKCGGDNPALATKIRVKNRVKEE